MRPHIESILFGYRIRGLPIPYLGSFSNLHEKGSLSPTGTSIPRREKAMQCAAQV
jgi:hypothetical protein